MPNLVGIGLSQVPTNSMLGGLAYQSPDHASIENLDLKYISQINAETADTAVDIFIYDTSKDSDGGAWRKRTTHTSWYNETLGTATRGTRREFPAVAILVLEQLKLTIYDGDDPDMPMWMIFNQTNTKSNGNCTMLGANDDNHSAISALNGVIAVGENENYGGLVEIMFARDTARRRRGTVGNNGTNGYWTSKYISTRNTGNTGNGRGYDDNNTDTANIVTDNVNDVAMTVLPNAPIDETTGLPIPTIAVGTDGGLSVIRDDGDVFDIVYSSNTKTVSVAFNSSGNLHFVQHDNDVQFVNVPIPTQDYANGTAATLINSIGGSSYHTGNSISGNTQSAILGDVVNDTLPNATSGPSGLTFISNETPTGYLQGAVSYATTSYNTGWMHGDIKGAFLSDTDATNITDANLVSNGDFSNGTTGWSGNASMSVSGGVLTLTSTSGNQRVSQAITVVPGKTYYFSATTGGNASYYVSTNDVSSGSLTNVLPSTFTVPSGTTTLYVVLYVIGTSNTATFDDIVVKLADPDRSVNNQATNNNGKGLGVFGTVTKSAVATGAELVAYSGFSASNYLVQPNNTDYSFGTGDFSVMTWVYPLGTSANYDFILELNDATTSNRFYLLRNTSGRVYVPWNTDVSGSDLRLNQWSHVVAQRVSGNGQVYVNGVLKATNAWTANNNLTQTGGTFIGVYANGNNTPEYPGDLKLSLMRISATTPSAEQIKKIYEDEKVLFQENAKATLYGSSDAVTALAYDEVTEQLHVGTSSGRSDFQGLRRINNTTTAVTTAISAHDEFIVEQ